MKVKSTRLICEELAQGGTPWHIIAIGGPGSMQFLFGR
ncbi:hypothetical protein SS05631_a48440 (plasmid) [Sinorhizobium sp. CCBAU 05631]|nr:hypothetical protein SS05631_a48440 [Sinorhizobium sp. CCBAU 05631]